MPSASTMVPPRAASPRPLARVGTARTRAGPTIPRVSAPGTGSIDSQVSFDERGLVPCVIQDWGSGEVLTLAYMNALGLGRTRGTGELDLWSRPRAEVW